LPVSIDNDNERIPLNADGSMNSTLFGITIDRNDEFENANDSIRVNDDGDSNEIDSRDRQFE
jgi:hypothetical protein